MAFSRLTIEERETNILFNEKDGYWSIVTDVPKHMNKFDKLGYECVKTIYYPDGSVETKEYKVPAHAVSFRSPEKRVSHMTDEQKEAARERMKRLRASQIANKG